MRETAEEIDRLAAEWIARLDAGGPDPDASEELEQWLAGDERRRGAFLRAQAAWSLLDRARALPAAAKPSRVRLAQRIGGTGLVAAAVIVATLMVMTPPTTRLTTGLGEIRRVPLEDGSMAVINSGTRIEVAMRRRLRDVELEEGQAWFQVAKDADRPFVVRTGELQVRAVGTAFAVERAGTHVEVVVTEGTVELWGAAGSAIGRLSAGDRAMLIDDRLVELQRDARTADLLAWRDGQIILSGETLGQAAAEFNRYNARRIVVTDPELARTPLVGWFRLNEPENFAQAAAGMLGAHVTVSGNIIQLDRAEVAHR